MASRTLAAGSFSSTSAKAGSFAASRASMARSSASKSIGSTTSGGGSSERSMVESGLVMPHAPPGSGDGASVDVHHFHGVVRLAHRLQAVPRVAPDEADRRAQPVGPPLVAELGPAQARGHGLPRVAAGQHVQ